MNLTWVIDEFTYSPENRVDLDLRVGDRRVGYFQNYNTSPLIFKRRGDYIDVSHLPLEEAKAVVEAVIALEG